MSHLSEGDSTSSLALKDSESATSTSRAIFSNARGEGMLVGSGRMNFPKFQSIDLLLSLPPVSLQCNKVPAYFGFDL